MQTDTFERHFHWPTSHRRIRSRLGRQRPHRAKSGQILADLDRLWPKFGRHLGRVGLIPGRIGRAPRSLGPHGPTLAKVGRLCANSGRLWVEARPHLGRHRPAPGRTWSISANFGLESAAIGGRTLSVHTLGQIVAKFGAKSRPNLVIFGGRCLDNTCFFFWAYSVPMFDQASKPPPLQALSPLPSTSAESSDSDAAPASGPSTGEACMLPTAAWKAGCGDPWGGLGVGMPLESERACTAERSKLESCRKAASPCVLEATLPAPSLNREMAHRCVRILGSSTRPPPNRPPGRPRGRPQLSTPKSSQLDTNSIHQIDTTPIPQIAPRPTPDRPRPFPPPPGPAWYFFRPFCGYLADALAAQLFGNARRKN